MRCELVLCIVCGMCVHVYCVLEVMEGGDRAYRMKGVVRVRTCC
jgi:hypothetical protein